MRLPLRGRNWSFTLRQLMSGVGHFRRFARVADWSGEPQEPDVLATIRHFRVAPTAVI